MIKQVVKMLLVWAGILVIVFLILEGSFRVFRQERDPLSDITQKSHDYLFKPDSSFHSLSSIPGEFDYMAHFNHFGYRGASFVEPKPAGEHGSLLLGIPSRSA